jgi:hypothetical protein
LDATLDSLIETGDWEKTQSEIIERAGISRDSFYRLIDDPEGDDAIKRKLAYYRRESHGREPAGPDAL